VIDPVAYAADGGSVVVGDGPELLAYRADGAPDWKVFTEGILVGVGIWLDQVITVDDQGLVCWWNRGNGQPLDSVPVEGAQPTGIAVSSDGAVAVLCEGGVWLVARTAAPRFLPVQGACALSWGPDRGSLGVGTRAGSFAAIDPVSGVSWGTVTLGWEVAGVAWSTLGQWVVCGGEQLVMVQGDGSEVSRLLLDQGPIRLVAVSSDGVLAACLRGTDVAIYELHQFSPCGHLEFRRGLTDTVFGPGHALAIGMDDGDATMVELVAGTPSRTEPHPGRGRNTWRMENRVEKEKLRGAVAMHRAGGAPIARWVGPQEEEEEEASQGSGCLQQAGIVGCVTVLMFFLCSGVIGLLWYAQQQGWLPS